MDRKYATEIWSNESDGVQSPIVDDVTAGHQYGTHVGSSSDSPERRLMLSILADALECVRRSKRSRETAEALEWILEEAPDRFCSFENICELLELDPQYLRRGVLESVSWTAAVPIPVIARNRKRTIPIQVAA